MKKLLPLKFNIPQFLIVILFFVNAFLYLFRSGADQLGGDEVAAYVSLMPFLHALMTGKFLPTFLVFFHEPLFQIIQLPTLIFGMSLFFVRLPNILSGIALFLVLYKIGGLLFGNKFLYKIILLLLYTFGSYNLFLRTGIHIGIFNLILASSLYFLLKFKQKNNVSDYYLAYKLLLLDFFVYIDAIFSAPGLIFVLLSSKIKFINLFNREVIIPTIIAAGAFLSWFISVYLGSAISGKYDWQLQAPYRLLARGGSYSFSAILDNLNLFRNGSPLEYVFFVFIFMFISIFDKKSRIVWGLLVGPFIFFNLVKAPTVHPLFFWVLILIASVLGTRFLIERVSVAKYVVLIFLGLALIKNAFPVNLSNPFTGDQDYKIAATFLRQITPLCDKVYIKTGLDGYAFRFYFDRGYVTEISDQIKVGFVDRDSNYLESVGFGKIAEVKRQNKSNLSIYQKDYKGNVLNLSIIDNKLFNFSNTLNYVSDCYFKK